MQYGDFDDHAKEYLISCLKLYNQNVKIFEMMMHIKR
jgi:hypothetical protein